MARKNKGRNVVPARVDIPMEGYELQLQEVQVQSPPETGDKNYSRNSTNLRNKENTMSENETTSTATEAPVATKKTPAPVDVTQVRLDNVILAQLNQNKEIEKLSASVTTLSSVVVKIHNNQDVLAGGINELKNAAIELKTQVGTQVGELKAQVSELNTAVNISIEPVKKAVEEVKSDIEKKMVKAQVRAANVELAGNVAALVLGGAAAWLTDWVMPEGVDPTGLQRAVSGLVVAAVSKAAVKTAADMWME